MGDSDAIKHGFIHDFQSPLKQQITISTVPLLII